MTTRDNDSAEKELLFWNYHMGIADRILTALQSSPSEGKVSEALKLLLPRILTSTVSLEVLRSQSPPNFLIDGAIILRGIYDASIQTCYILKKQEKCEERARLYLDFAFVERHKGVRWADKGRSYVAAHVRESKLRPKGEPELKEGFERVKRNYQDPKGRLRNKWYKGNLCGLAKDLGYHEECELLQSLLSGAVHSSALTLRRGGIIGEREILTYAWAFTLRAFGRAAEYANIELNSEDSGVIGQYYRSMLGG